MCLMKRSRSMDHVCHNRTETMFKSEAAEVCCRRACAISFIDHIIKAFFSGFIDCQALISLAYSLAPECMKQHKKLHHDFIKVTAQHSSCDLSSPQPLLAEFDIWERAWNKTSVLPR